MAIVTAVDINPGVIADINAAADIAYERVALDERLSPDEIPSMSRCMAVSALIMGNLEDVGYRGRVQPLIMPFGNVSLSHFYVRLSDEGGEISADGTWQQFLGKKQIAADLPNVLIARGSAIMAAALGYGVREQLSKIWHPDHWRLPRRINTPAG